jgi:hypothetical protein
LPVPYFLVTFTLPEPVQALALTHAALLYDLLFRESAATLQQVAANLSPVGLNTATEGQVKCSHPEEVRRS